MFEQDILNNDEQSFYFLVDGNLFSCRLYFFHEMAYMDLSLNHEEILVGQRVIPNQWIVPNYLGLRYGNFRFETSTADSNNYIDVDGLNTMFKLVVYKADEYESLVS